MPINILNSLKKKSPQEIQEVINKSIAIIAKGDKQQIKKFQKIQEIYEKLREIFKISIKKRKKKGIKKKEFRELLGLLGHNISEDDPEEAENEILITDKKLLGTLKINIELYRKILIHYSNIDKAPTIDLRNRVKELNKKLIKKDKSLMDDNTIVNNKILQKTIDHFDRILRDIIGNINKYKYNQTQNYNIENAEFYEEVIPQGEHYYYGVINTWFPLSSPENYEKDQQEMKIRKDKINKKIPEKNIEKTYKKNELVLPEAASPLLMNVNKLIPKNGLVLLKKSVNENDDCEIIPIKIINKVGFKPNNQENDNTDEHLFFKPKIINNFYEQTKIEEKELGVNIFKAPCDIINTVMKVGLNDWHDIPLLLSEEFLIYKDKDNENMYHYKAPSEFPYEDGHIKELYILELLQKSKIVFAIFKNIIINSNEIEKAITDAKKKADESLDEDNKNKKKEVDTMKKNIKNIKNNKNRTTTQLNYAAKKAKRLAKEAKKIDFDLYIKEFFLSFCKIFSRKYIESRTRRYDFKYIGEWGPGPKGRTEVNGYDFTNKHPLYTKNGYHTDTKPNNILLDEITFFEPEEIDKLHPKWPFIPVGTAREPKGFMDRSWIEKIVNPTLLYEWEDTFKEIEKREKEKKRKLKNFKKKYTQKIILTKKSNIKLGLKIINKNKRCVITKVITQDILDQPVTLNTLIADLDENQRPKKNDIITKINNINLSGGDDPKKKFIREFNRTKNNNVITIKIGIGTNPRSIKLTKRDSKKIGIKLENKDIYNSGSKDLLINKIYLRYEENKINTLIADLYEHKRPQVGDTITKINDIDLSEFEDPTQKFMEVFNGIEDNGSVEIHFFNLYKSPDNKEGKELRKELLKLYRRGFTRDGSLVELKNIVEEIVDDFNGENPTYRNKDSVDKKINRYITGIKTNKLSELFKEKFNTIFYHKVFNDKQAWKNENLVDFKIIEKSIKYFGKNNLKLKNITAETDSKIKEFIEEKQKKIPPVPSREYRKIKKYKQNGPQTPSREKTPPEIPSRENRKIKKNDEKTPPKIPSREKRRSSMENQDSESDQDAPLNNQNIDSDIEDEYRNISREVKQDADYNSALKINKENIKRDKLTKEKRLKQGDESGLFDTYLDSINMEQTGIKGDGDCLFSSMALFLNRYFNNNSYDPRKVRIKIVDHIKSNWDRYSKIIDDQGNPIQYSVYSHCNQGEWCKNRFTYSYYMGKGEANLNRISESNEEKKEYKDYGEKKIAISKEAEIEVDEEGKIISYKYDRNGFPVINSAKWGGEPELHAFTEIEWPSNNQDMNPKKFKIIILMLSFNRDGLVYNKIPRDMYSPWEPVENIDDDLKYSPYHIFLVHHQNHYTLANPKQQEVMQEIKTQDSEAGRKNSFSGDDPGDDDARSEIGSGDEGASISSDVDYDGLRSELNRGKTNNERMEDLTKKFKNNNNNITIEEAKELLKYDQESIIAAGNIPEHYDSLVKYIESQEDQNQSRSAARKTGNPAEEITERPVPAGKTRGSDDTPIRPPGKPSGPSTPVGIKTSEGGKKTRKLKKKTSKKKRKNTRKTKPKKKKN